LIQLLTVAAFHFVMMVLLSDGYLKFKT